MTSDEPETEAGRRLFTDNEPMDMLESDGVTPDDILAIEAEMRANLAAEAQHWRETGTNPLPLPGWSLDFDAIGRWLILTDPDGAAAIVAKDVDLEYGGDIAEHWRRAALIEGSDPASPEAALDVERLARALHVVDDDLQFCRRDARNFPVLGARIAAAYEGSDPASRSWPGRAEMEAMTNAEVNDVLESRGLDVRVIEGSDPASPEAALDVERLGRAIKRITEGTPGWLAGVDQVNGMSDVIGLTRAIAAEYARLAESHQTGADRG